MSREYISRERNVLLLLAKRHIRHNNDHATIKQRQKALSTYSNDTQDRERSFRILKRHSHGNDGFEGCHGRMLKSYSPGSCCIRDILHCIYVCKLATL
jgi:hypothetical protein